MKTFTEEELQKILKLHQLWIDNEKGGIRADLSRAVLRGAVLRGANLIRADLSGAVLIGADLRGAVLRGADLSGANLIRADLSGANLRGADLSDAVLIGADLRGADLRCADLSGADLSSANLSRADLRGAENLDTVIYDEETAFYALACPEEGDFIGYKKCRDGVIVKLLITGKRSSATSRKCRCSEAKVLEMSEDYYGKERSYAVSKNDCNFFYHVGETLSVPDFDENRWNECSTGIHFFITRHEAENYN